jgi:4-hydroxy-tetrahydrodipicolinate synthase
MTHDDRLPFLRGALTAIVTPFRDDGAIDIPAFERLVAWQIDSGSHGLVPCGTTGEGATLRPE